MIPTFWFEQTVELDENLAREAKVTQDIFKFPFILTNSSFFCVSIRLRFNCQRLVYTLPTELLVLVQFYLLLESLPH